MENILEKIKDLVFQSAIIKSSEVEFSEEVRDACKANYCGKYNTCWTCPPGVGEIKDLKPKCLKYDNALVFTTKSDLEDSFDFEGMMNAKTRHDKIQTEVVKTLNFSDCKVLGTGGCNLCKKCAYPNPCRFPDKVIQSMESYGINVVNLASTCNINYHNGGNTVTYFSIIFF